MEADRIALESTEKNSEALIQPIRDAVQTGACDPSECRGLTYANFIQGQEKKIHEWLDLRGVYTAVHPGIELYHLKECL